MEKFFRRRNLAQLRTKYKKISILIAAAVVFVTTYALILPAITLDNDRAKTEPGVSLTSASLTDTSLLSPSLASDANQNSIVPQVTDTQTSAVITEPTTLTADDNQEHVQVDFDGSASLPQGVELKVKEIKSSDSNFQVDLDKAQATLGNEKITASHFYDISFSHEGQEVEPKADVKVAIKPGKALTTTKDKLEVLHFKADGSTEKVNFDVKQDGAQISEVIFTSDGFSDFAIVEKAEETSPSTADATESTSSEESTYSQPATPAPAATQESTVRFVYTDNNGAVQEVASTQIEANSPITTLPEAPFREGYRFTKWTIQGTDTVVTADTTVEGDMVVEAQFDKIDIYTITVNYFYHNKASDQDVTFNTEIFQVEEKDLPYRVTPPASTEVDKEAAGTEKEAIYYPSQSILEYANTKDMEAKDAADGSRDFNITTRLEYVPYTSEYIVHYMLKNLNDDKYSEIEKQAGYGVIGSTVTPQILTYTYANFEKTEATELNQKEG